MKICISMIKENCDLVRWKSFGRNHSMIEFNIIDCKSGYFHIVFSILRLRFESFPWIGLVSSHQISDIFRRIALFKSAINMNVESQTWMMQAFMVCFFPLMSYFSEFDSFYKKFISFLFYDDIHVMHIQLNLSMHLKNKKNTRC